MEFPSLEELTDAIFELAEWVRSTFDENDVLHPQNAEPGIEIHLEVTDEGWQVCQVEAYDDDEDILSASVWLPYDSDTERCEELAEQLLEEIEDAQADQEED